MLQASSEGRAWVRSHVSAKPRRKTGGEENQRRNISRLFAWSAPTQRSGKHQWLEAGCPAVNKKNASLKYWFVRDNEVQKCPFLIKLSDQSTSNVVGLFNAIFLFLGISMRRSAISLLIFIHLFIIHWSKFYSKY